MAPENRSSQLSDRRVGAFDVWQRGLTLADALNRFADGASWSRCKSRIENRFDKLRTDPRSPMADRVEATVRLQDMARAWEEQARLLEQVRARLIGQLRAGELLAIGFAEETASSSKLTIVPHEAWRDPAAIDWERSAIHAREFDFIGVRVLAPRQQQVYGGGRENIGRVADDT